MVVLELVGLLKDFSKCKKLVVDLPGIKVLFNVQFVNLVWPITCAIRDLPNLFNFTTNLTYICTYRIIANKIKHGKKNNNFQFKCIWDHIKIR